MHMHMHMHTHASTCTCHAHACREKRILEGCPYRVSVCNFKTQRLEEPRTRAVGAHSCGLILYFTTYRLLHSTRPHSTRYSLKLTRAARGASPTDEASLVRTLKRCSRLARARGPGPTAHAHKQVGAHTPLQREGAAPSSRPRACAVSADGRSPSPSESRAFERAEHAALEAERLA